MVKKPKIKNKNKKGKNKMIMKILSLFSGIGAFEKALNQLNVKYELVNYCEIDKYASKAYSLIHNVSENMNLGDITKVDTSKLPKDIDLITYGFPCQDISLAGKQQGMFNNDGSKTRSGLFFEALRIIEDTKPKIAIAENVKNLVSKKFNAQFQVILQSLEEAGYNNYWKVLNAKDFGIPQNRERVFIVSIRKDIDPGSFEFPKPFELKLRLKDMLEDEVDEKYYLSQKMINCFLSDGTNGYPRREIFLGNINRKNQDIGNAVTTLAGCRPSDNYVVEGRLKKEILCDELLNSGSVKEGDVINHSRDESVVEENMSPTLTTRPDELGVVVVDLKRGYPVEVKEEKETSEGIDVIGNYSKSNYNQTPIVGKNGIAPTVTENHGQVTAIAIKNNTKQGYLLAEEGDAVDISGRMEWHRGTVQKGVSQTITTAGGDNVGVVVKEEVKSVYTPLEEQLFTEDGNIKRYIGSDIIDIFKEGQVADISFPNGYNKGPRVHDECPTLNVTTTKSSFVVKVKDKVGNEMPLYTNYKKLVETVEKNEMPVDEVKHMDLYNRNLTDNCGTLSDPCHNNNRLWDGLRIRKLTPKECFRLMGFEDKDIECLIENKISNTQLYKMAGNSIVVDVLKYIFVELFKVINIHYKEI